MAKLFIIADDFTGALDTGIQFTAQGNTAIVIFDIQMLATAAEKSDIVIYNADSRHLDPDTAYQRVYDAVLSAVGKRIPFIYKKTDSVLRGNIGSELTAALHASGQNRLVFVPSFPKAGRVLKNGVYEISGVPVSESPLGKDPFNPVRHSGILEIIAEQSEEEAHSFPAGMNPGVTGGICVFDAETKEDIALSVKVLGIDQLHVSAGCAGFAETLSSVIFGERCICRKKVKLSELLVVNGSMNAVTTAQLDRGEALGIQRIILSPEQKLREEWTECPEGRAEIDTWWKHLKEDKACIIDAVSRSNADNPEHFAKEYDVNPVSIRVRIAHNLARIVKSMLDKGLKGAVLCVGGDTLQELINVLQIKKINLISELFTGVVLIEGIRDEGKQYIITKSGGLGPEELISECISILE